MPAAILSGDWLDLSIPICLGGQRSRLGPDRPQLLDPERWIPRKKRKKEENFTTGMWTNTCRILASS